MSDDVLVKVENLKEYFPITGGLFNRTVGHVKAVDGVSLEIKKGETLGIVGESGCGKSTTGRAILQLLKPTEGKVIFEGRDITKLNRNELRNLRTKIQLVFQDPYSSLNSRFTVGTIIGEALLDHKLIEKEKLKCNVI